MKNIKLSGGVVIPMVTPLDEKGGIDRDSLEKMLELYIGSETIPFILGTTGEAASLSQSKRDKMVEETVTIVNNRSVIYAGIFDTCFENILRQAETYAHYGIDIFVAHLPSYYPLTQLQIERYFTMLADRVPGHLIIYNIPATTKISIPLEIAEILSHHQNIVGLKDSERSVDRMIQLVELFAGRQDWSIFSGWTNRSAYALELGFDGIVPSTGNLIPHRFSELYQAVKSGKKEMAAKIQAEIDPIADFHQKDRVLSDGIILLKLMMHAFDLCGPAVLPPLSRFKYDEEQKIISSVKAPGLHINPTE